MKKSVLFFALLVLFCGCGASSEDQKNQPVNSPNVTITEQEQTMQPTIASEPATATPVPTLAPTFTPTPLPTSTPTPLPTSTPTPTPIPDTEAPVFDGLSDKEVYVGETVSYKKGVTVTDNIDTDIKMEIDTSNVKLDVPGEYQVTYTATDSSGNTATETILVVVKVMDKKEAEVNKLADKLIADLITEDMSKWDTCYTLWNWCRTKIRYAYSAGDRSTIYAGAYEGLHDRSGDCYAYYATFTVLLQKCGIETLEVRRVGGESNHWWNLVNLGDGWYHCDSSPRKAGHTYKCFMQTDAQVQAYTEFYKEKPNYYVFDESLYPERETTIVYDGKMN